MILLIHLIAALSSIVLVTIAFFMPSRRKQIVSWMLAATTLVSGTVLVISSHSNLLKGCLTGIIYFSIISAGIVVNERKLARQED